ncbi:cadherin-like beta sandwich domain-containing protein [Mucilaginibacter sp.]|uniref:cadherin-like beta sandwich domain-containing protein n=1 Tax=Mucilaginibacter sp. TaxID=1882438 RepID=UPI002610B9AF|nr:cadherin-like beta sandwich domain-containing protein [Mucilaginibacter sp.]MDB4923221.1 Serine/threonine-protein kinase PknD [Mucilaginibacter sp.]
MNKPLLFTRFYVLLFLIAGFSLASKAAVLSSATPVAVTLTNGFNSIDVIRPISSGATAFAIGVDDVTIVLSTTINSIDLASSATTNGSSVDYTVTFGAAVTGLTASNFSLTTTGVSGASIGTPTTSDNITWTVPVNTGTGDGATVLNLVNDTNLSLVISTSLPFTGQSYTIDKTAPTASSIIPANATPTKATSINYTVTFSESVTGVDVSDFALTKTSSANGSLASVTGSGTTYTVTVNSITGNGTIRLDLNNSGTGITDVAGNAIAGGFTAGQTYTIDNASPTASNGSFLSNNARNTFAKVGDIITLGFTASEHIQTPVITIGGNSVTPVNVSGNLWTGSYTETSGNTQGQVAFALTITDDAGNTNSYTSALAGLFVTFDKTSPTVSIGSPSVTATGAGGSASYTVTYADAHFNTSTLSAGDITLITTGTATGTVGVTGTGATLTVTISNVSGLGTIRFSIGTGTASDKAGNLAAASAASGTFVVKPSDATLSALTTTANNLTPVFNSNTLNYTATVPNGTTTTTVTPTSADVNATIRVQVNGGGYTTVGSGASSSALALNVGNNPIDVQVTAQDGATIRKYKITVTRLSTDALLTNLKFSPLVNQTWVPGPSFRDYVATVANGVNSITVTPTTRDATATVMINNVAVASGVASPSIPLNVGNNTITTVVTAGDGVTKNTYSVIITREGNALLTSLRLNPKTPLITVPGFNFRDYTVNVANSVSSVTVTPVTQDPTSTVKVNDVAVTSGTASGSVSLDVGDNTITTVVTAANGTAIKIYSMVITRLAPPPAASIYDEQLVAVAPVRTPGIVVHKNVSPNGDGNSDVLQIDGIVAYPDNTLQIMSRNGALVYEAKGYDNTTKAFDGHASTNGKLQQPGTYFYSLNYKVGKDIIHNTGFIVLKY